MIYLHKWNRWLDIAKNLNSAYQKQPGPQSSTQGILLCWLWLQHENSEPNCLTWVLHVVVLLLFPACQLAMNRVIFLNLCTVCSCWTKASSSTEERLQLSIHPLMWHPELMGCLVAVCYLFTSAWVAVRYGNGVSAFTAYVLPWPCWLKNSREIWRKSERAFT